MNRRDHWSSIYTASEPSQVGWFQPVPERSLDLIRRLAPDRGAAIIDLGGGSSTLVDHLLRLGYHNLTVLDIAGVALRHAQIRLGALARRVTWLEADILTTAVSVAAYDLWHDRAVFRFLMARDERSRYLAQLTAALRPGAHVEFATFGVHGPDRCSGLPVQRYSPESLASVLGGGFRLVEAVAENHTTPGGVPQAYQYAAFRREGQSVSA